MCCESAAGGNDRRGSSAAAEASAAAGGAGAGQQCGVAGVLDMAAVVQSLRVGKSGETCAGCPSDDGTSSSSSASIFNFIERQERWI